MLGRPSARLGLPHRPCLIGARLHRHFPLALGLAPLKLFGSPALVLGPSRAQLQGHSVSHALGLCDNRLARSRSCSGSHALKPTASCPRPIAPFYLLALNPLFFTAYFSTLIGLFRSPSSLTDPLTRSHTCHVFTRLHMYSSVIKHVRYTLRVCVCVSSSTRVHTCLTHVSNVP